MSDLVGNPGDQFLTTRLKFCLTNQCCRSTNYGLCIQKFLREKYKSITVNILMFPFWHYCVLFQEPRKRILRHYVLSPDVYLCFRTPGSLLVDFYMFRTLCHNLATIHFLLMAFPAENLQSRECVGGHVVCSRRLIPYRFWPGLFQNYRFVEVNFDFNIAFTLRSRVFSLLMFTISLSHGL